MSTLPAAAQQSASEQVPLQKESPAQAASPSAPMPDEVMADGQVLGKRVEPLPGDVCRVCNQPLHKGDAVYVVRGQRIGIHLEELASDLRMQLTRIAAQLEPRGAFIGTGPDQRALSSAWFLFGVYVLLGLVFAAICAHRALHTGHSPSAWFGIGLVLNAVGYLLLLIRPKREVRAPAGVPAGLRKISATHAPQPCPMCGTLNHPAATACLGCGARLEPKTVSEVVRAGLRSA